MSIPVGSMLVYNKRWKSMTPKGDGFMIVSDFTSEYGLRWEKILHTLHIPNIRPYVWTENYVVVASTILDAEIHKTFVSIKFNSYSSNSGGYSIRIVDSQNRKILAEGKFKNTISKIHNFDNIYYSPDKDTTIEVQARYLGERSIVYISNIILTYDEVLNKPIIKEDANNI